MGAGPAEQALKLQAHRLGADVRFLRRISDEELCGLLHHCTALIQPGEEDFGLGPLEANGAGRPAVALARGGALVTTIPGRTGVLFAEQSAVSLIRALDEVEAGVWPESTLRAHAWQFAEPAFHRGLETLLADLGVVTPARPVAVSGAASARLALRRAAVGADEVGDDDIEDIEVAIPG